MRPAHQVKAVEMLLDCGFGKVSPLTPRRHLHRVATYTASYSYTCSTANINAKPDPDIYAAAYADTSSYSYTKCLFLL